MTIPTPWMSIAGLLCPPLSRALAEERAEILRRAYREFRLTWRYQVCVVLHMLLWAIIGLWIVDSVSALTSSATVALCGSVLILVFLYAALWVCRYAVTTLLARRAIYRQLNARRYATCEMCGYDLTGTRTGRCSECGASCMVSDGVR